MKYTHSLLALSSTLIVLPAANAGVECLSTASAQMTTKDYHCDRHCGTWAERVPPQTISLEMQEPFKSMNAFFRNAQASCSGGPCWFGSFPPVGITSPQKINYTFRHHSRPVIVSLTAEVCVYNAATPPEPTHPPAPASSPSSQPPTPKPPTPAPTPVPPQKDHTLKEAGSMTSADCERMKNNWKIDARSYCTPYNVNLVATTLTCKSDADNLGRSVSGIFLCMK